MSWRTVVIKNRCKLDLKMGYMVVRGEETNRVFLDEISLLLIENTAVSLTCCLLEELANKKIKVIFCDKKRNPVSEMVPFYGSFDCSQKLKMQICWSDDIKGAVWTEIVTEKIKNQMLHLLDLNFDQESELLKEYMLNIQFRDETNREGHSAKVYFNALFGKDFTRSDSESIVNSALNYGYSIILSAFNREIVANGYLTQLGLFHDNMFNQFNLSCDLMEPFRIYVDRVVKSNGFSEFTSLEKYRILDILNDDVIIDSRHQTLLNAIKIYTKSAFNALNDSDVSQIKFPR